MLRLYKIPPSTITTLPTTQHFTNVKPKMDEHCREVQPFMTNGAPGKSRTSSCASDATKVRFEHHNKVTCHKKWVSHIMTVDCTTLLHRCLTLLHRC